METADGSTVQFQVFYVYRDAGVVTHCIRASGSDDPAVVLVPGTPVDVLLDWERRSDHMQQHSGQHLISAVAMKLWGAVGGACSLGRAARTGLTSCSGHGRMVALHGAVSVLRGRVTAWGSKASCGVTLCQELDLAKISAEQLEALETAVNSVINEHRTVTVHEFLNETELLEAASKVWV